MIKRHGGNTTNHMMGGLFTFALFGLFVVLSLLIVVIGVDGYRNVVDDGDITSQLRTSLGYVAGKMRSQAPTDGARIEQVGGVTALVLTELNDLGETLETIIYHQDGALYEAYINAAVLSFDPRFGTKLVEIEAFEMEQVTDMLLKFTATTVDGQTQSLHVALPGRREGNAGE